MSLKFAILGLLSYKPQTGYEIKSNFEKSIQYIWNADQAQIYRTLYDITSKGLVKYNIIQQSGSPNKKLYELTKEGEAELNHWLAHPVKSKALNNAELLQIFFSGKLTDEEILSNLKRLRSKMEIVLLTLSSLENTSELFSTENKNARIHFFFQSTLQLGMRDAKLNLEWFDEMIDKIEKGQLPPM